MTVVNEIINHIYNNEIIVSFKYLSIVRQYLYIYIYNLIIIYNIII